MLCENFASFAVKKINRKKCRAYSHLTPAAYGTMTGYEPFETSGFRFTHFRSVLGMRPAGRAACCTGNAAAANYCDVAEYY